MENAVSALRKCPCRRKEAGSRPVASVCVFLAKQRKRPAPCSAPAASRPPRVWSVTAVKRRATGSSLVRHSCQSATGGSVWSVTAVSLTPPHMSGRETRSGLIRSRSQMALGKQPWAHKESANPSQISRARQLQQFPSFFWTCAIETPFFWHHDCWAPNLAELPPPLAQPGPSPGSPTSRAIRSSAKSARVTFQGRSQTYIWACNMNMDVKMDAVTVLMFLASA